jgi:hypothetical protein
MEEEKLPFFRKIDEAIFNRIDKFKLTPNYTPVQDFYNSLEEEQQKLFKGVMILMIVLLPLLGLGVIWWQNNSLRENLKLRRSLISRANEIVGQGQSLKEITPTVFSENPIDSQSMMTSRLSQLLSTTGIDLSKIQVTSFDSKNITSSVVSSEANFNFNALSTEELMNLFSAMIGREKFRISSVEIKRNPDSNLLQGTFSAIHYSIYTSTEEE